MWKSETVLHDSHALFAWRLPVSLQRLPVYLLVLVCWFQWLCTRVFWYLCNSIFICWCHLYMRWSYLCTVDRCVHYTYSICMKLDMLVSKNVVSTCKVLFVNPVLCWPAVSWGPNPSCNFTLGSRLVTCVWICREMMCVISTSWKCLGSRDAGRSCLITNDSTFCVVLWFAPWIENPPFRGVASYWAPTSKSIIWEKEL